MKALTAVERIKNRIRSAENELYDLRDKASKKEAAVFALKDALADAEAAEQDSKRTEQSSRAEPLPGSSS